MSELFEIPKALDEATLKRAKKEINEKDAKQVAADIKYIREWLEKQDHLKSRMDDEFILKFLRGAKFSYTKCQQLIENFWVNRAELKDVFSNRSFKDDSLLMELADCGDNVWLPMPDDEGRRVGILRADKWDLDKYDMDDYMRYQLCCNDLIMDDPRTQINGVVFMLDMSGLNSSHATQMTPDRSKKMMKGFQNTYPIRIKQIHYYNYPKIFDVIFPVVKMVMNDKMKKRLNFHGSDLSSVHKFIPKRILPKEYGGEFESIDDLNAKWVKYLLTKEKYLLSFETYGADLEKFYKKAKKTDGAISDASINGVTGTFRKLNVD